MSAKGQKRTSPLCASRTRLIKASVAGLYRPIYEVVRFDPNSMTVRRAYQSRQSFGGTLRMQRSLATAEIVSRGG
jgi:hypothetical protein